VLLVSCNTSDDPCHDLEEQVFLCTWVAKMWWTQHHLRPAVLSETSR
jgi:hypothetical protein